MKSIFTVASYISNRYQAEYGARIEEMKLHKMLYLSQRECIVQTDEPLFRETFQGWRLGPVSQAIHEHYANDSLNKNISEADMAEYKTVMDIVFKEFAHKDMWSLSRLTQGEFCWKESRKGVQPHESSSRRISTEDIRVDARRIKERREMLAKMGCLKNE